MADQPPIEELYFSEIPDIRTDIPGPFLPLVLTQIQAETGSDIVVSAIETVCGEAVAQ